MNRETLLHPRTTLIVSLIAAAAATRLAPHPMNVTPIAAIALFGGAHFRNRWSALGVPLLALFLTDLVGRQFHSSTPVIYACFAFVVAIGRSIQRDYQWKSIMLGSVAGSLVFYIVSNAAHWASGESQFPLTIAGLVDCYIHGLPLFRHTLFGDGIYTLLLFGILHRAEVQWPMLQAPTHSVSSE